MIMKKTGMIKNKIVFLSAIIVFSSILAYLVIAAAGDNVKVITLTSGTNMTSVTNRVFNVSFDNTTDIPNALNATFFFNISGTWTKVGNTTAAGCNVKAGLSSCAINLNASVVDGVYSLNATIYNASASISVIHAANLSTKIYIDGTAPQVGTANVSGFSAGANISTSSRGTNHTLNISIFDATIGIHTVFINITNSTGVQNATFTAIREGSTDNFVVSAINTSHFPNGEYNITIYANDTLGNLNNSAVIQRVIFDNTAPVISSFSCTPNSVEQGETITCSCSTSDALSGIDSTTFTTNPSTANTGPSFQISCSTQDKAGNTASTTTTYEVISVGSGSSSGGSSGGSTGLSPPSSPGSSSGSNEEAEPSTQVSQDSEDASANEASSRAGKGILSSATGIIFTIIILAILVTVVVMIVKSRKR